MAMGKQRRHRQQEFWVAAADMPPAPGHPFYTKLNSLLGEHGFDEFVESLCAEFYHEKLGRPSIPPGVYFRMHHCHSGRKSGSSQSSHSS